MKKHQFEFDQFLFDQAKDAVGDIRTKLIDEAWFGRPASSPRNHDHPSLGWEVPEGREADDHRKDPFADRWSAQDQQRAKAEPERAQELDFDR